MKLKKIKLNALSQIIVGNKVMNALKGGNCCQCSCYWEGKSGSSTEDNKSANYSLDTISKHGCNQHSQCNEWPLDFVRYTCMNN